MTHFKQYKPFMAYLELAEIDKLKKFSKQTKLPMAQIIREAISQRMVNGDPYQAGFNAGQLFTHLAELGLDVAGFGIAAVVGLGLYRRLLMNTWSE